MALIRRDFPGKGDDDARQAAKFRRVHPIDLPTPGRRAEPEVGELTVKPLPGPGGQLGVPGAGARLIARKPWVVVRHPEGPRFICQAIKKVGPPQWAVQRYELRGRFAPTARLRGQLPQLDPRTMLHGRVFEVDLEPVPHDHSDTREGEDVLHHAS
jgi:hypothetical protein